jgi:Zn-dependent peptidase ImmA (M78 family)
MRNYNLDEGRSVLSSLRGLIPMRRCRFDEALRIAELQAARLQELTRVETAPIPNEIVSELPRIQVTYRDIPTSGLSYWDGQNWVIALNRSEPWTRQRFTLLHEYKHIMDHGSIKSLYPGGRGRTPEQQAEQAADYFAGCVLMPRRLMKQAWGSGLQTPGRLARHFETSERAVAVRLAQIGLTDNATRCEWPQPNSRRYHRSAISITTQGVAA